MLSFRDKEMKNQIFGGGEERKVHCSSSFSLTFCLLFQGHLSTLCSKLSKATKGWEFPVKTCKSEKINIISHLYHLNKIKYKDKNYKSSLSFKLNNASLFIINIHWYSFTSSKDLL